MFFIVAGFFSKSYSLCGDVERCHNVVYKYIKRLLKPVYFTYVVLLLYLVGISLAKHDFSYAMPQLVRMIWASGEPLPTRWGEIQVGTIWFVFALFWAKTSLYYLSRWPKLVLPVSLAFSIAVMLFHHHITKMVPLCILQGLTTLPFVAIGWYQRNYGFPYWIKMAAIAIWPFAIAFSDLELYSCYMKCYPLSLVGACGGTMGLYYLSKWISKAKLGSRVLGYVGVISLAILCMHEFVDWSDITNTVFVHSPWTYLRENYYIFMAIKYSLILGLALLITRIPLLKKIYV